MKFTVFLAITSYFFFESGGNPAPPGSIGAEKIVDRSGRGVGEICMERNTNYDCADDLYCYVESTAEGGKCKELDPCKKLKVLNTKHWREGDNGQFFYFSGQALTEIVGPGWDQKTFKVFKRSAYVGGVYDVKVFQHWSGAHGRYTEGPNNSPKSGPNQWHKGDTIEFRYQKLWEEKC